MTRASRRSTDAGGADCVGGEPERIVPMRLQRFLARAGVASRRGSEDLMTGGRVSVNGAVVRELGSKVDPRTDEVRVDDVVVRLADGPSYFALNKPAGYVTTMKDPQGRPTVADLFPNGAPAGLFPVGRLDQDTEGLLLLTTDGDMAHLLMHPRHHVEKTYLATVDGVPDEGDLTALQEGVALDDGTTAPARARVARRVPGGRCVVELTIREGRKRQVRRMLGAIGHPVVGLERVAFGPVMLGDLARGQVRALTAAEVDGLRGAGR